jgi:hypothetical protein
MAKDWHRNVTQGLVDAVNMIVSDYKGEKDAKANALKEKEKLATKKEDIDGTGSGPYMPLDKKKGASKGGGKAGNYSKGYRPEGQKEDDEDEEGEVKKGMPWSSDQFKAEAQSGDAAAYKKFFTAALKKFDVSGPDELKGDKKKEFFDYIDKNWKADHEEVEPAKKKVEAKKEEPKPKVAKVEKKTEETCKSCGSPISKVKKEEKPVAKPIKKEEKAKIKKEEPKNVKLSGKKEKVKFNPIVKQEETRYVPGDNPFQRVVQSQKKELNEAFQHTWGFGTPEEVEYKEEWMEKFNILMAEADPHLYIDPLQLKVLYTTGITPQGAVDRFRGFRSFKEHSDFRRRRRLVHGQDDGGNADEY